MSSSALALRKVANMVQSPSPAPEDVLAVLISGARCLGEVQRGEEEALYARVLALVLDTVPGGHVFSWRASDRVAGLDAWFAAAPPLAALTAVGEYLAAARRRGGAADGPDAASRAEGVQTALGWLATFDAWDAVWAQLAGEERDGEPCGDAVARLVALPDKAAAAVDDAGRLPASVLRDAFLGRMLDSLLPSLAFPLGHEAGGRVRMVAAVLEKLLRAHADGRRLATLVVEAAAGDVSLLHAVVARSLSSTARARLVQLTLHAVRAPTWHTTGVSLLAVFGRTSAHLAPLVVDLVLSGRELPLAIAPCAADLLAGQRDADKWALSIARPWARPTFVRHAAVHHQAFVTIVLVRLVRALTATSADAERLAVWESNGLIASVMGGVQVRLESALYDVRRLGMMAGEAASRVLTPDAPLAFEYKRDAVLDDVLAWTGDAAVEAERRGEAEAEADVEADVEDRGASDALASESDSDSGLEPYDMDSDGSEAEEQDAARRRRHFYVRTCVAAIRANEDHDQVLGALESVERIVHAQPPGLDAEARPLLVALLHLSDSFDMDDLDPLRLRAMVATCVAAPAAAAPVLIDEFYAAQNAMSVRGDCLQVLADAATELSRGSDAVEAAEAAEPRARPLSANERIIAERLAAKTRYFHRAKPRAVRTQRNAFHAHAGAFFFPLLSRYDDQAGIMELLGRDFYLLGRFLFAAATILEAARNAPAFPRMVRPLWEVVLVCRCHANAFVRQASLYAFSRMAECLSPSALVGHFGPELDEVHIWLSGMVERDTDEATVGLASACLRMVAHKLAQLREEAREEMR